MGKLYFHCGDFHNIPEDAEMLGSLKWTNAQMSAAGYELQIPGDGSDRAIFSNSFSAFYGARVAVREGKIDPDQLVFVFHRNDMQTEIGVGIDGDMKDMMPGFFDQNEIDLLKLL